MQINLTKKNHRDEFNKNNVGDISDKKNLEMNLTKKKTMEIYLPKEPSG
jgi:hypothetical protein